MGRYVTPITDGWWQSIQFHPGPTPLPEWDARPESDAPAAVAAFAPVDDGETVAAA